jgi:hypothetical protein
MTPEQKDAAKISIPNMHKKRDKLTENQTSDNLEDKNG